MNTAIFGSLNPQTSVVNGLFQHPEPGFGPAAACQTWKFKSGLKIAVL